MLELFFADLSYEYRYVSIWRIVGLTSDELASNSPGLHLSHDETLSGLTGGRYGQPEDSEPEADKD